MNGFTEALRQEVTQKFIVRTLRGWSVFRVQPVAQSWRSFDRDGRLADDTVADQVRALGAEVVRAARQFRAEGTCDCADTRQFMQDGSSAPAAAQDDVLIPFASVDPHDGASAARLRDLAAAGARGLRLHPSLQGFAPDDPAYYPLYEAATELAFPVVFRTGQTGIGAGLPGGRNRNPPGPGTGTLPGSALNAACLVHDMSRPAPAAARGKAATMRPTTRLAPMPPPMC